MINERKDFETLDATRLTLLSLLFQRDGRVYVCVEVRVDFEREEMPETNNCSSKEFIAVYIVNLRLHWWSSLFPSKLRRDWILDWFSKGSRLDSNWFLLSMNFNLPSNNYSRRKNVIKMDLKRMEDDFQKTMGYRVWGPGSLQLFFRSQDTWRAQIWFMKRFPLPLRFNSFWNTCY